MRKSWIGFLGVILLTISVVFVNRYYLPSLVQSEVATDSLQLYTVNIKSPNVLYGMVVDNYTVIEDKIKRNEVLGDILEAYNVPANIIHQVSQLSRNVFV